MSDVLTDLDGSLRPTPRERARLRMKAAAISLGAAVCIFGAKLLAYLLTDSAAILSDALESIVNIVAAAMAAFSVWYASQPADENHPYGHGKIEDFSAGVEGALIVLAAAGIVFAAVPRFFAPRPIEQVGLGTLLVVGATLANGVLGWYLVRTGQRLHSRAIEADGRHVLADVVTSVGVVVALGLVVLTDLTWIDPLMACLVAAHIVGSGLRLMRTSIGRLMDEADDDALERLAGYLDTHRPPEWIDAHELRAWWSGDVLHVDVHLVLPHYWTIEHSHRDAESFVRAVNAAIGLRCEVVVHVDPCSDTWCSTCEVADCPVRAQPFATASAWTRDQLVRRIPVP